MFYKSEKIVLIKLFLNKKLKYWFIITELLEKKMLSRHKICISRGK